MGSVSTIRRRRQKKAARRMLMVKMMLGVSILSAIIIGTHFFGSWKYINQLAYGGESTRPNKLEESGQAEPVQTVTAGITAAESLSKEEQQEWQLIYEENEEILVLVNKEHSLDTKDELARCSICNGRLEAAECLYDDLCAMLEAGKKAGFRYWVASAYRSYERQKQLISEDVNRFVADGSTYEQAVEKTYEYTMPAGCSEHQTGLALDILCAGNMNMDESQEAEPANAWLQEHCTEYGFILRYPKEKEALTGIKYEPWHFRYVGQQAAEWLTQHGLALEEVAELSR